MRKRKWQIFWVVLILLLVGVRAVLPRLILPRLNEKLANISDVAEAHVGDLSLSIFRGAYYFNDVTLRSKVDKNRKEFVHIDALDISIAWRELIHKRILADANVEGLTLTLGVDLSKLDKESSTQEKKEDAKNLTHAIIPFDVSRATISNSRILYHLAKTGEDFEVVNGVEGRISNISNGGTDENPQPSLVAVKGDLFGGASLVITGKFFPLKKPIAMDFRLKSEGFHLEKANRFLIGLVPVNFTKGTLNVYSEIKYENGDLKGYAKPFFHDVKMLANPEKYVSIKHFFVEIGTAFGNLILRNGATKTTAALVEFEKPKDGKFETKIAKIFSTAFHNGYVEAMPEDFESSNNSN